MIRLNSFIDERNIFLAFKVSLWIKGVFAFIEIIAGIAAYFVPREFLLDLVVWVTKDEFAEDPHDLIAKPL